MALSLNGSPNLVAPPGLSSSPGQYDGPDGAILDLLSSDPAPLDQLIRDSGLELPALCGALERLAGAGVARDIGGWWERT
jgi:predicted Rossmann fold nucleotide-binding protein DprA/Smf involved in DNA uptake